MSPIQAFLIKQANTLTLQSPTLGGFQVNNGQFDVISALEGDKLQPQNGTYNKLISIFKHMIPGFREAVDMKNKRLEAQRNYDALQKANYRVRVPFLEPDNTPLLPIRFEASNRKPSYQEGGEMADNTRVASGRPKTVLNRIPWNAGRGPAGEGPMRLFNDPYINLGLMAMGPMVGRFKPGETPSLHINGVKLAPPTLQDIMNYLQLSPKISEAPRAMGLGVHGLSRMSGKSPLEVIKIMSLKFGNPQTYPKALDNSEPAYGWTFENPDLYRLALLLFNLK